MTIACQHCKRTFADDNALYQHNKVKHRGKVKQGRPRAKAEREPSLSDELVDALLAAACGEDVPEHIALMFPDEIAEARRR